MNRLMGAAGSIAIHATLIAIAILVGTVSAVKSAWTGQGGTYTIGLASQEPKAGSPDQPLWEMDGRSAAHGLQSELITDETSPNVMCDVFAAQQNLPVSDHGSIRAAGFPAKGREGALTQLPAANGGAGENGGGNAATGNGAGGNGSGGGAVDVYSPPPVYPVAARRKNIEGDVVVQIEISADGLCATASVATSSGSTLLDDAALVAVKQWKFRPATKDGKAVASSQKIRFVFTLKS